VKGESKSVTIQKHRNPQEWKKISPDLISGYQTRHISNMDECRLSYNLLPNKTYAYKGESCHGSKSSKERLTILLGGFEFMALSNILRLPA